MIRSIRFVLLLLPAAAGSVPAAAEVIDIDWGARGRFERQVTVAPGKFAEVCGKLLRNDRVAWRFEASGPLDFNIHYHEGQAVRYPAREDAAAGSSGTLQAALDQDYCWMWTNKARHPVSLRLALER
ncbi:MAG: hypothetical protein J0L57_00445 [Burkholderiales bacterium]|nr:hypothetical protein [Burkholderiales bacterium]